MKLQVISTLHTMIKVLNIVCKESLCYKSSSVFSASITSPSSSPPEHSIKSELLPALIRDALSGETVDKCMARNICTSLGGLQTCKSIPKGEEI